MNITFVTPYFYPAWAYGGPPRVAYALARALVERGHTLRVLTTDTAGSERVSAREVRGGCTEIDGIATYYYRNVSNYLAYRHRLFCPLKLFRDIRSRLHGSDIVHIHEFRSMLTPAAHRAAAHLDIPFVLSPHGSLRRLGKQSAKAVFDILWGRRALEAAAAIMAVSPLEEAEARIQGVAPSRVRLVPNGICEEEFQDLPLAGAFRRRLGIGNQPLVLFMARLNHIKGADLLVRAFGGSGGHLSDVLLVVAGPDEGEKASLARLANDLGCRVVMPGRLDSRARMEALVDAELLVIPSRHEMFPVTALEALMCGTPVLASSACGLPPVLDEEHGVMRFASGDPVDLMRRLTEALNTGSGMNRKARMGRSLVQARFSMSNIAREAEKVYADIVAAG